MAKLNQIIAIEKGIKSKAYGFVTELDKAAQKPELFSGFSKNFQANNEDGEKLPPESKRVAMVASEMLRSAERALIEQFNITARKDWTNCEAKAPVKIDELEILPPTPVTYLLFLEKQLTDLGTFVDRLPTLDTGEDWELDTNTGLHKTPPVQTHRTKKEQKPIVLYPATDKHPAQTQIVTEDVISGYWTTVKFSGAMPRPKKQALLERIYKLLQAVKQAREAANGHTEVASPNVGTLIFDYLMPKES
jgi:hypothetical protein